MSNIQWNLLDIRFNTNESTIRENHSLITGGEMMKSPYTLTLEQCQTAIERIALDADMRLREDFKKWAAEYEEAEGIKRKKRLMDPDHVLAYLPDESMAITAVTFISKYPHMSDVTLGYSIKERLEPTDDIGCTEWGEPTYQIMAHGFKLLADGHLSKSRTTAYITFWTDTEGKVQFETCHMASRRRYEEEWAKDKENMQKEIVAKAFGEAAIEAWSKFSDEQKAALVSAARQVEVPA